MQVQRPAPEIGPFKGIGFGDTAGRTLDGVETITEIAVPTVEGRHGSDDTRLINRELPAKLLEEAEPSVGRQGDLGRRVGVFLPLLRCEFQRARCTSPTSGVPSSC